MQTGAVSTGTREVQNQAAVKVAAMGLDAMRKQAEDVTKLIEASTVISDPAVGQKLDVFA